MIELLLAALAFASPVQVQPQPSASATEAQSPSKHWIRSSTRVASLPARTAFPRRAGALELTGMRDFSHPDIGIDSALQYGSNDGQLTGTVYVYLPGLAHPGIAAYATQQALTAAAGVPMSPVRRSVVPAGGVPDSAVRMDYENYIGGRSTHAAFIHAGRWLIKIRVSGPGSRSAELDAAMKALLDGMEFGTQNPAMAASLIDVSPCAADAVQEDARLLADVKGAEQAAHGFIATFDGAGIVGTESGVRSDLPSRVPPKLCRSNQTGPYASAVPILRAADGPPVSVSGRTRLLAIIDDAGTWLEVVHAPNLGRYVMLLHQIGSTSLLGGYDAVPSDRQIVELLSKPEGDAFRTRAMVVFAPDGAVQLKLSGPPAG